MNTTAIKSPSNEICSIRSIAYTAFLGGPLGGFYLISKNFKAFEKNAQAKRNILYGFLATIAIYILSFFLPNSIPNHVFYVSYSLLIGLYATKLQKNDIDNALKTGFKKISILKNIGVIITSLLITCGCLLLMSYLTFLVSGHV